MIPKIIHQIWIGEEPPYHIKEAMQSVKDLHPNYEYILHGNECIEKYNLQEYFNIVPHAFIADTIRLNELQKTGGWYIDADCIALQSIDNLSDEVHGSNFSVEMLKVNNNINPNSAFFGISKDYDLTPIIDVQTPRKPMISIWNFLVKDFTPIPMNEVGIEGTIIKDLLMNTWGKKYQSLVQQRIL